MLSHAQLIELQPMLSRVVRGDEDALQEANLRLVQAQPGSIRNSAAYAACVARRCRIDLARPLRRLVPLPDGAPIVDSSAWPAERAAAAEELERLRSAIDHLPPRQREAVENPCRASNSNRFKAIRSLRCRLGAATRK